MKQNNTDTYKQQQKKINKFFNRNIKEMKALSEFWQILRVLYKETIFPKPEELKEKMSQIFGQKKYRGKDIDFITSLKLQNIYDTLTNEATNPNEKLWNKITIKIKRKGINND